MSKQTAPIHIAVIPDGNRRWAKQRGLSAKEGHKAGYETLKSTAFTAFDRGAKYLSAYLFSTENWSRTQEEVSYLMGLAAWILKEEAQEYHRKGIKLRFLGTKNNLDPAIVKGMDEVERLTEHNAGGTMNLCFNYGGRRDIVEAVNRVIDSGIKAVDEDTFSNHLSTAGTPDPDLVIRTSGEHRLSNFLVWETAYSELYFADCMWPDFDEEELEKALADFSERKRRFGK